MSGAEDASSEKRATPLSETAPEGFLSDERSTTHSDGSQLDIPVQQMELFASPAEIREPFALGGPMFAFVAPPAIPAVRHPNFADAGLFLLMMLIGFLVATGALGLALHFHLWGLESFEQAKDSTVVALSTQLLIYVVGVACAIPFFGMAWGRSFFDGVHWHVATALQFRWRLLMLAVLCNVLAMLGNLVLPFPKEAPIDKLFGTQSDAWMLFIFGVTVAPFFEEMIFRGFLLPAVATAWDWCDERLTGRRSRGLDGAGNPIWSWPAMVFAALAVSAPFALMHSAQVAKSWGPLSLLYCVSLVLCTVRLASKSLAASTLVHSAYNFLLFAVMLVETDGFRHMDKL